VKWVAGLERVYPLPRHGPRLQHSELGSVILESFAFFAAPYRHEVVGGIALNTGNSQATEDYVSSLRTLREDDKGRNLDALGWCGCRIAKHDCKSLLPRRGVSCNSNPGFLLSPKYVNKPV